MVTQYDIQRVKNIEAHISESVSGVIRCELLCTESLVASFLDLLASFGSYRKFVWLPN